jgi:hypothetical protein
MKAPFIAAVIAAAAIGAVPLASADPATPPVPNMNNKAVAGQDCNSPTGRFIFGQDASGNTFICGNSNQPHVWVPATVIGVRQIGAGHCVEETQSNPGMAQSPDGVALICVYPTDTWEVRPSPTANTG